MIRAVLVWLLLCSSHLWAAIDTYEFHDDVARERFQTLTQELRCPKCQNQNLADSNSPIAADLRREVYRMVEAGESNEQIVDFMVVRYGEFVLYRPKMNTATYVLWFGPLAMLVIGLGVIFLVVRARHVSTANPHPNTPLNGDEQSRLARLLKDKGDEGQH